MNEIFADLYEVAEECLSPIVRDPTNRGRSWDQCYTFFQTYRNWTAKERQANRELACLHLGFYLASWGMFRGSGALIQKDHTIYGDIIDLLLADAYEGLWRADFFDGLLAGDDALSPNNQQIDIASPWSQACYLSVSVVAAIAAWPRAMPPSLEGTARFQSTVSPSCRKRRIRRSARNRLPKTPPLKAATPSRVVSRAALAIANRASASVLWNFAEITPAG